MDSKYIDYLQLIKENCAFALESSFSYSKLNEKPIATLNVISCIGIYLAQNDVQILAHIYKNPKKCLKEVLGYLYKNKVIKNESFQKAYIIKSKETTESNFIESKDYLECFIKDVEIIEKGYAPIHFAFDKKGDFYWIDNVKEKQE